jgi:hypothetical protein
MYWMSNVPQHCDLCDSTIKTVFVDGKTKSGPWGCLCSACHRAHGYGLGTGLGQEYKKQKDGRWKKTQG